MEINITREGLYVALAAGLLALLTVAVTLVTRTTDKGAPEFEAESGSGLLVGTGVDVGYVVTGTLSVREGEELNDAALFTLAAFGADVATSVIRRLDEYGDVVTTERSSRGPSGRSRIVTDDVGEIMTQYGYQMGASVPIIVAQVANLPTSPTSPIEMFIDIQTYPVAQATAVADLLGAGTISLAGQAYLTGRSVNIYDVTVGSERFPVTDARVWMLADGLKLKVEEWYRGNTGDADYVHAVEEVVVDVSLGNEFLAEEDISLELSGENPTDYVEVLPFDPPNEQDAPVSLAPYLLFPATLPISDTYTVASSAFITGTWDIGLTESKVLDTSSRPFGERSWWVVQELTGAYGSVVVIQGDEGDVFPPINLVELWPPAWVPITVMDNLDWGYTEIPGDHRFADDTAYEIYLLEKTNPRVVSGWKEPFDYLVTWVESGGIRINFMVESPILQVAIDLASAFRDSS